MPASPLEPVSVIIPTFNRAAFLDDAIASVFSQDYPCFELLVVDDGSSDQTRQLVERWEREVANGNCLHRGTGCGIQGGGEPAVLVELRYFYQENQGVSAARNLGIKEARYDLLAFLDSDDRFRPGKLSLQAAAMAAEPEIPLSHTEEIWWRNGRHLNQKRRHRKEGGDLFARSLELCVLGMSTVMLRRWVLDEIGLFDQSMPCCEDYDLWLRLSARYPVLFIDKPLTEKHGGRPDQLSVQHRVGMDRFRITALNKLLQSGVLNQSQRQQAAEELRRKCRIYGQGCLKHGREEEARHYLSMIA